MGSQKPLHTIVLDAGPMLKNDPSLSTLLAKCDELVTVPSILSEIKDKSARDRVETTVRPFLTLKVPTMSSIKVITDFARKTGDLAVLSRPDVQVLALAYEIECEKNGGDWRLRNVPGQKAMNGSPPSGQQTTAHCTDAYSNSHTRQPLSTSSEKPASPAPHDPQGLVNDNDHPTIETKINADASALTNDLNRLEITGAGTPDTGTSKITCTKTVSQLDDSLETLDSDGSDSEGWITPSNVKHHQAKDTNTATSSLLGPTRMQVAVLTTDYAMQNVLLQMNLNLLSPSMQRIRNIKTHILRCHACFEKTRDLAKQFCPRCGKPTLTRVSCSTSQDGKFVIHLKRNMQWNHRGDRFSIPKPVSGCANGKVGTGKGGGQRGWGQELILAEDQKEYVRALNGQTRKKDLDLMDENHLPGILTGDRGPARGRPKIGGGRNVNSKKR